MTTTYKNLIGGQWVASHTGKTFQNINPANHDDIVGEFQPRTPPTSTTPSPLQPKPGRPGVSPPRPNAPRSSIAAAKSFSARKEQYANDMTREMGKVLAETRGDVQEAVDTAFYMAGEGRRLFGQTTPSELPNKFAMSLRMPVGVCGMIAPWNFPMAIPSWKLFPALVCGNTCVIKPAEDTPLSTYNLVQTLIDAGLPPGVVNIVTGFGPEAGAPLVAHPGVRAISFTGSSRSRPHRRPDRRRTLQAMFVRNGR